MNLLNGILDGIKKHAPDIRKAVGVGSLVIGFGGVVGLFAIPAIWLNIVLLSGGILSLD